MNKIVSLHLLVDLMIYEMQVITQLDIDRFIIDKLDYIYAPK